MLVPLKGLGDVGWIPDQESFELAPNAITDLQNMRVRNGWAQKVGGTRQVFSTLGGVPLYIAPFATGDQRYIITAQANKVVANLASGQTDITLAGTQNVSGNVYTSAVMNGIFALCNGTDKPMYWTGDTATDLAVLPGWNATFRAKTIAAVKYHWVALGITEGATYYPHRVLISAAALPGDPGTDWDYTSPTNDAYRTDVVGDGILVWALPFGDGLMLYKDKSMSLLRYAGDPQQPWSIQPMHLPIGMLAPNCGVVVPGVGHVVLTRDDVVWHDGSSSDSVLDGVAKKFLQENMDPDHYAQSYLVHDVVNSEVQICFPEEGNDYCTKAILWNYRTKKIGYRDLPNTACGCNASFNYATETFDNDTVTFDSESALTFDDTAEVFAANESRVLMGGQDMKIFVMDSTDQQDGVDFTGHVEFGALCNLVPELKEHQILLSNVWLDVDADPGVTISVYFGAASVPGGVITYGAAFTYTVGSSRWAEGFACGPYPALKLASTDYFRVRSAQIELSDEGQY